MEHLGHGDAEEVVEVAASGAPAPVLVIAEAVEEHVPEDKAVTTVLICQAIEEIYKGDSKTDKPSHNLFDI